MCAKPAIWCVPSTRSGRSPKIVLVTNGAAGKSGRIEPDGLRLASCAMMSAHAPGGTTRLQWAAAAVHSASIDGRPKAGPQM